MTDTWSHHLHGQPGDRSADVVIPISYYQVCSWQADGQNLWAPNSVGGEFESSKEPLTEVFV